MAAHRVRLTLRWIFWLLRHFTRQKLFKHAVIANQAVGVEIKIESQLLVTSWRLQAPLVTRREQLGTDDHALQSKGRGRGRARGRGRGAKFQGMGEAQETGKSPQLEVDQGKLETARSSRRTRKGGEEAAASTPTSASTKKADKSSPKKPAMKRPASSRSVVRKAMPEEEQVKSPKEAPKENPKKSPEAVAAKPGELSKRPRTKKCQENKEKATWAGRWVPTEPVALCKMEAIKRVFTATIAEKVRSQSKLQSPFFRMCTIAFKQEGLVDGVATQEDYIASAETQVEPFLKEESVRT